MKFEEVSALLLSMSLEKIPTLFDFTVDIDVNSALSNNAEDDPRKTVFN